MLFCLCLFFYIFSICMSIMKTAENYVGVKIKISDQQMSFLKLGREKQDLKGSIHKQLDGG